METTPTTYEFKVLGALKEGQQSFDELMGMFKNEGGLSEALLRDILHTMIQLRWIRFDSNKYGITKKGIQAYNNA